MDAYVLKRIVHDWSDAECVGLLRHCRRGVNARGRLLVVEFVIARNPDPDSSLPFLVRVPLGDGVALKVRDTWPRTAKIYCHRADV